VNLPDQSSAPPNSTGLIFLELGRIRSSAILQSQEESLVQGDFRVRV
jgi:hypothetical protein